MNSATNTTSVADAQAIYDQLWREFWERVGESEFYVVLAKSKDQQEPHMQIMGAPNLRSVVRLLSVAIYKLAADDPPVEQGVETAP